MTTQSTPHQSEPQAIRWLEWTALAAILALATYLRAWRIEEVPPGFNSDEAVGAVGALRTLREGLQYSYEGQGGGGALGFYFAAAAFWLFGPSIAAIRGLAAWAGVVGIFANYWGVREMFRGEGLARARWIAGLSTLGLAVSVWHIQASRIAFAGIGVPFLMLPSVYFLWWGLNRGQRRWPFVASGLFLGGLMYIYLSGVFAPPFYAAFFIAQWLIVVVARKVTPSPPNPLDPHPPAPSPRGRGGEENSPLPQGEGAGVRVLAGKFWRPRPSEPYLTRQFWHLFATGLTAALLLLPILYVLLTRPELEPGTTRVGQAFFLNPQINQGDPWGLLWRSFVGNFEAYGVSFAWLLGRVPRLVVTAPVGLLVFGGFWLALWRGLRGRAAYLFVWLWFVVMLLPSILSPDIIPHNLRTIGATNPTYIFAGLSIVSLFELVWSACRRWLPAAQWPASAALAALLAWQLGQASAARLYQYFYIFPETNDAKAAYHVYAVKMAEEINREPDAGVAFLLPRNTAAGDVFRNFTVDFLTDLAEAPAAHYWVIDDETTLADDLTAAAREHATLRLVRWKTSKHTGADPKEVIPYYLEKYGHYERTDSFEYFDIDTYRLEASAPDFRAGEQLREATIDFGGQLRLTGYALGDAGNVAQVQTTQAGSNDLLWLRLAWEKIGEQPENLKVSALIYAEGGQLVTQMDKLLQSNILQVGSRAWPPGAQEATYFLLPIPPATPPGNYTLRVAVYSEASLARLGGGLVTLSDLTIVPSGRAVSPDDLDLALPTEQELLPGLTLVGFETLPGETVRAGEEVGASLIWRAGSPPPSADITMSLFAKAGEGEGTWPLSEPVGLSGGYPTSRWQAGDFWRGWLRARIPPTLEPGTYKLRLRLSPADDPAAELLVLPIGDFEVTGWPRNFEAPQPQLAVGADFAGQATLVGLDTASTAIKITPGGTLAVRLHWRAEAEFAQSYTAFVHLIGPDGRLYGQVDQIPGGGQFPTTGWLPGEYIHDDYALPVAAEAPAGDYQLEIGLYDPNTGQRLPVGGGDDKVLVPGVRVE